MRDETGVNTDAAVAAVRDFFASLSASIPDEIRGYGHVKQASIEAAKAAERALLDAQPAPARDAVVKRAVVTQ